MITFLDENDVEYGALATIKATNAVNGERSLTGTIASGDYVLSNIERGWRLRFDDEYFVVTYAKPVDEGRDVQVEFDAVHQFFWDFDKSSVYDQLTDGSHTFIAYLDFIFKNSGYSYTVDSALNVYAFEKQSFGLKKRLTLFNDIITSTGVEFQVNGKVVRILEKVGTDLSTVVRKNFNMNELTIEKNIGDFVTYQKGFGAYFDEEDHSKGRLEVEYTSPLTNVYGRLEAEPLVDERYSQSSSLLAVLKENVDNSYTISVSLDMEDLTRAGYKYKQPVAGDYIMAINETIGFKEKIRIVSFTSEYDVQGNLIKHGVTCNDIGSVKKLSASYTHTQHQAANAEVNANIAYEFANKALVSADGKNTNYYGDTFPVDNPKGTLKKGDLLFLTVGDTVKQYYWNGADWIINPVLDDVEAFKEQIAEELKDVPNREEFENKIAEELATSKAEIETQIESAKTQAESNAKEYADTINQETAKVAELANAAADEIKADLVNVKNNLTDTSLVANNAQAAVDAAKQELANVNTKVDSAKAELTQAKQDLISHAQQLQTQANAQTELSKRVTSVETTADGTKTTVNELTKTVAQNGKDITSVTNRTKTVEDDLANTKTTLTQVQTTANSASQKTATLETGLNGLSAKFENLKIGGHNYLRGTSDQYRTLTSDNYLLGFTGNKNISFLDLLEPLKGETVTIRSYIKNDTDFPVRIQIWFTGGGIYGNPVPAHEEGYSVATGKISESFAACNVAFVQTGNGTNNGGTIQHKEDKLEKGNIATDYSPNEADLEQKVAEYKQTADQNYARLQSNLQTLDGTVKQNKSEFDQTASQLKTTISAVEGKIPTNLDSLNLMTGTRDWSTKANKWHMGPNWSTENVEYQGLKVHSTQKGFNGSHQNIFVKNGDVITFSFFAKATNTLSKIKVSSRWDGSSVYQAPLAGVRENDEQITITSEWKRYSKTIHITSDGSLQFRAEYEGATIPNGNTFYVAGLKLAKSSQDTGYSENPTDVATQISSLSSELNQTKDGITLLATKTELNTAKSDLQSGITTATNKANAAQSAANSNAQTISTHTTQISALNTGLQAKVSQSDFNTLSGRVTTAENNITAKANELSSKITSVEGKIPTSIDTVNLVKGTGSAFVMGYGITNTTWNETKKQSILDFSAPGVRRDIKNEILPQENKFFDFKPIKGTTYTQSIMIDTDATFNPNGQALCTWFTNNGHNSQKAYIKKVGDHSYQVWSTYTWNLENTALRAFDWRDLHNVLGFRDSGTYLAFYKPKLTAGNLPSDWSPSPEDTANQISSLSSEFKQTTDSIKASVSSLDKSTIKSSSLTINSDGIVMKAGKSTTDVANAIGSYFSVNQNAINLFSDKINVKGNMIVNGAITSDKIASKSINTAHLNGKIITADVISSNAVTAGAIKAGAVTTDKMSANSINGDRIAAGTLDAAKIKAGSITASQIASGTITSNQIKAGGISAANIAVGAITGDKIAAGAIDANKIAANAISANMITGGKLNSTNGATSFDLNSGTITFNNNFGYIQRVVSDKVFEISSSLVNGSANVREHLSSAYIVRKSDNSRKAGMLVSLYNPIGDKPTAQVDINADSFNLLGSQSTPLLSINGTNKYLGNWNVYGWGDIPLAFLHAGLTAKDVGLEGHTESLKNIIERLCEKTGLWWM